MATLQECEDAGLFKATFHRASPTFAWDVEQFERRIAELKKELGFEAFIPFIEESENGVVELRIVPATTSRGDALNLDKASRLIERSAKSSLIVHEELERGPAQEQRYLDMLGSATTVKRAPTIAERASKGARSMEASDFDVSQTVQVKRRTPKR